MTTNTASWSAESSRSSGFGAALLGLAQTLRRYRAQRRTNMLLADLDDYTLDDIGVDPSHVRRTRPGAVDWVVQTHSGTARLIFIGR